MIGRLVSALAGKTISRAVGGVAAGRAGAVAGFAMPSVLPVLRRSLGPAGMLGAALGTVVVKRVIERRQIARAQAEQAARESAAADPPAGG